MSSAKWVSGIIASNVPYFDGNVTLAAFSVKPVTVTVNLKPSVRTD